MADSEGGIISISDVEVPSDLMQLAIRIDICREVVEVFRGWSSETAALKECCLSDLSKHMKNLVEIVSYKEALQTKERLCKEKKAQANYLKFWSDFIINNIPDRFNCPSQVTRPDVKGVDASDIAAPSATSNHEKKQAVSSIPKVSYLSLEEFEKVPKYMKGRVTYDKINVFIDVLNKVLSNKYTIFKKKRSTLKKNDADLWNQFHKQELKETKGMYFCVGDDFQTFNGCALDKTSMNMLTILRHCQRLREIRTGGILRYVLAF